MTSKKPDAYDLMPDQIVPHIPPLYATENIEDPTVHVKLFTPWTNWTWFVIEYCPEDERCFGLVDGFEEEMGYFDLDEMRDIRGPGGLRIERDLYFKACPLSQCRRRW